MQFCSDFDFNPKNKPVHRYGKTFVFINGTPYFLTFRDTLRLRGPALRIKDVALSIDKAKLLPWKTVSSKARVIVHRHSSVRPVCLRLTFQDSPNLYVFLVRSVPKSLNRLPAMESMSRETKPAADEDDQCVICFSNASGAKFAPCGHSRVCGACAFKLIQTTRACPLCRKEISFFTRSA